MENKKTLNRLCIYVLVPTALVSLLALVTRAQNPVPGRNVNMVSGTQWPGGDPFLQRQNEPSMAVSTRNPMHLLAGANDYRTVDLPGGPEPPLRLAGDAWLGVFKSFDGGATWRSTLLPGYPQDTSPPGMASPLKGFDAASDPVVKAGTNGLFYYFGIAFDRGEHAPGVLFSARFIDNNNKENGDPIAYVDTRVVDDGSAGQFLDKPWVAVDVPRAGAVTCTFGTQSFLGGNLYVAYAVFVGGDNNIRTKLYFARSRDCGQTWTRQKLSEGFPINQGTHIAINPSDGAVYVIWRQFRDPDHPDMVPNALLMAKSVDGGQTFTKAVQIFPNSMFGFNPFDQGTSFFSFRTSGFPTTIHDGTRLYLAWSQRGMGPGGDARIVLTTSTDGVNWTVPFAPDNPLTRGHEIMPSLAFAEGRLMVFYYYLMEDHTVGAFTPAGDGLYTEARMLVGNLPGQPEVVFTDFVADVAPPDLPPLKRRHTLEVFMAQGSPGQSPVFSPSVRVSQYLFGSLPVPRFARIEQLQFNPPNLPLFALGTAAFIGDYIDIAALAYRPVPGTTVWTSNTSSTSAPVFHGVWTDNRDVRPPLDGDWAHYVPVGSTGGASLFDPNQLVDPCVTEDDGRRTGMRNQNIYTSRITEGLFVAAPGNAKPLGFTTLTLSDNSTVTVLLQRSFVVFVQNTTNQTRSFRLHASQPAAGQASFLQFSFEPTVEVSIPRRSSISRTVFVTSSNSDDFVTVEVKEIDEPGGTEIFGGLQSTVILNPDISNPDISNPDISNPDISNPDISNAEVYNPDISNPDISNPDISNPDISNPDISNPDISNVEVVNPDISNPDISNPDISNPDISNPDISNPDISNPDISNVSYEDTIWTATNNGNTTAAYTVKLLGNTPPAGIETQLVIHRFYTTPVAVGCELKAQTQNVVIANIVNPAFLDPASPDISNPDISNPDISNATFFLEPGSTAQITLRVVDFNINDGVTFTAASAVSPAVVAQAVNTLAAVDPAIPDEPAVAVPLTITTTSLADGIVGVAYSQTLQAIGGVAPYTWSVSGSLPTGLALNSSTGEISGSSSVAGTFAFTAQVTDSASPTPLAATRALAITIANPVAVFFGQVTDVSGDAAARQGVTTPDLTSGSATVFNNGTIKLTVGYAAGTFNSSTTQAQFLLDTDQNVATGSPGTDSGCSVPDNAVIGVDFLVVMRTGFAGNSATIFKATGGCNIFTSVGTASVTILADGMEVTFPMSLLENDNGLMNFKVTTDFSTGGNTFSGLIDRMPDAGVNPASTSAVPPIG